MVRILYNDCYGGGFQFSPAFVAEIARRTGGKVDATNAWRLLGGQESLRCNPAILALFDEKGAAWSSGPDCALMVREIPDLFAGYWEIEECEGNEYVRVVVAEALADVLEAYMASPRSEADHALLVGQYARIQAAREELERSVEPEPRSAAAAAGGGR